MAMKASLPDAEGKVVLSVRAGEIWSDLVHFTTVKGWSGLESLTDIPGSVGAAPVSNIGAYGTEVGSLIQEVRGYDLITLKYQVFSQKDCHFAYRSSIFKEQLLHQFLVTEVVFALHQEVFPTGEASNPLVLRSQEISAVRASKLPDLRMMGTAGSFFKNPVVSEEVFLILQQQFPDLVFYPSVSPQGEKVYKLSAGWLIERAGMKGYRYGKAGVYEHHALVLVNRGGSPQEILEVKNRVQDAVHQLFGILLEPEVVII